MEFLGVKWVGINAENGRKLLLSLLFIVAVIALSRILRWAVGVVLRRADHASVQTRFWMRQAISLLGAVVLLLGLLSIWFNDPTRLATALGLVSAGLAFALQQPVTAIGGYFVILRGATFNVADRISMGGVRGDVLRLGFLQRALRRPPARSGSEGLLRITDNWLELTVRFIVPTHLIRGVKDRMSRLILAEMDKAGIGIASATYDIVRLPPIDLRRQPSGSSKRAAPS